MKRYKILQQRQDNSSTSAVKNKMAPVANGVENSEPPAGVEANVEAVLLNKEAVDAENNEEDDVPNNVLCGEAPDGPNKEDTGAEVDGVANREDAVTEEDGVLNKPLPEEAAAVAADACGAVDVAGVADLANNPVPCVEGCEFTGKCRVGCTLLAAASSLAVSLRSASRNGSFPSPLRR